MKKQNIGLALLLLGLIYAVSADTLMYWIGVLHGIVGVIVVVIGAKEKNKD